MQRQCCAGAIILFLLAGCRADADPKLNAKLRTEARLSVLHATIEQYRVTEGAYPTTSQSLPALLSPAHETAPLRPGGDMFKDGWGRNFIYRGPDSNAAPQRYTLYSAGANGRDEMGAGDDVDCCHR
jgi:hypothetical protein